MVHSAASVSGVAGAAVVPGTVDPSLATTVVPLLKVSGGGESSLKNAKYAATNPPTTTTTRTPRPSSSLRMTEPTYGAGPASVHR